MMRDSQEVSSAQLRAPRKVRLRALDISDAERVHCWQNDPDLYSMLGGVYRPVSRTTVDEWIRKKLLWTQNEVNFAICRFDTGEHIGNLYLRDIDSFARRTELHVFIGDERNRGHGFGSDAVQEGLAYAFSVLGLEKVFLLVLAGNCRAVESYSRIGFVTDGTLRHHFFKDGAFRDAMLMSILADEWRKLR